VVGVEYRHHSRIRNRGPARVYCLRNASGPNMGDIDHDRIAEQLASPELLSGPLQTLLKYEDTEQVR